MKELILKLKNAKKLNKIVIIIKTLKTNDTA